MDFQQTLQFKNETYDVITLGELVVDFISGGYLEDERGKTMKNLEEFSRYFGGSPGNIAVNLKALGFKPGMISAVGEDFLGDYLLDFLLQRGVPIKGISRIKKINTSIVFVSKSINNPSFLAIRGSDQCLRVTEAQEEMVDRGKILHFTSWSLSHEPTRSSTLSLLRRARDRGMILSMDPNFREVLWDDQEEGRRIIKEVLAMVDFVKPSYDDALSLFPEESHKPFSPENYLRKYLDLGAKMVILTLGSEGLIAGNKKEELKRPAPGKLVVDTTGAGDAFWSGLYASLLKGFSIEKALEHGSIVSAYKLGYTGGIAPLPRFEELMKKEEKGGKRRKNKMLMGFMNPQGNFDQKDSYWTEHPDFGGQLVYVKELALALDRLGVEVEIFTRRIEDPEWPEFKEEEEIYQGSGVKIIRIPFGPKGFLRKEELWPHLKEYAEGVKNYYEMKGKNPDFITSHYGDGGLSAVYFKELTGIPFSFTAHSLGAQKMDKLKVTEENEEEMNRVYRFNHRIDGERRAMEEASLIFVSTDQERIHQYSHDYYDGAISTEDGKFRVASPGVNLEIFNPDKENPEESYTKAHVEHCLKRDLANTRLDLPVIISSSRLEVKKNHLGLIKAYGENTALQEQGNVLIALRGVEDPYRDYGSLKGEEKAIMDDLMRVIEEKELKGKVAFINLKNQQQLAAGYRFLGRGGGVFALTTFYEPFGLAPLEAMACGLVAVVTKNGGPSEVLREEGEDFGFLVDPEDPKDIGEALLKALRDKDCWKIMRDKGIKRVYKQYNWTGTAKGYLEAIEKQRSEQPR